MLPSRPGDELVKRVSPCLLSQGENISQRDSVPFALPLLQKCSDSPSGCVRQRWNDAKQSKQLRWSLCLCERECGNACKDSHVASRLCLSRSYLSAHAASTHISSFTSLGPAYKPETWVWKGTKPLDFHFHLINDRMYMSGHESTSHLEYAAESYIIWTITFAVSRKFWPVLPVTVSRWCENFFHSFHALRRCVPTVAPCREWASAPKGAAVTQRLYFIAGCFNACLLIVPLRQLLSHNCSPALFKCGWLAVH